MSETVIRTRSSVGETRNTEFWWGIRSVRIPRKTLKDIQVIKMHFNEMGFDDTAYITPNTQTD
jgi:hypothetical protein